MRQLYPDSNKLQNETDFWRAFVSEKADKPQKEHLSDDENMHKEMKKPDCDCVNIKNSG